MKNSLRLGLTGGIGSGKSTVATLLAQQGAVVIDADAISKAITEPDGAAITQILAAFGPTILTNEGALNRVQMRQLIYADVCAKRRLENIVHPLVKLEALRQAHSAESQHAMCIVFDIPLLVETAYWREVLHQILVIDCSPTIQIKRVTERSNLPVDEIQRIIATQATREHRLSAADIVLFNECITMTTLAAQVRELGTQFGL